MQFTQFLTELTNHYGTAGTCPGVMVSEIEDKANGERTYYAAVQCFPGGTVASRKIVARATGKSLSECFYKLYRLWKSKCEQGEDGGIYTGEPIVLHGNGVSPNMAKDIAALQDLTAEYPVNTDPGVAAIDAAVMKQINAIG